MDRLRDEPNEVQLRWRWGNPVQQNASLGKLEIGIGPAHAGHIAVHNRTEAVLGIGPQLAGGFGTVGNEIPFEKSGTAEGVFVASRHRQQVHQGIEVPEPVLDGSRRQHQHILEHTFFKYFAKAFGDLRSLRRTVKVPKLMRFIQHQHLEAVAWNAPDIEAG